MHTDKIENIFSELVEAARWRTVTRLRPFNHEIQQS
jgi:hypothetical protein